MALKRQAPALAVCEHWRVGKRELFGLFVAALVVRISAVLALQPRLRGDGVGYVASGEALANGGLAQLQALLNDHGGVYSLFLAGGLLIPNASIAWLATIAQAVLGAATVVVITRLTAREMHSRTAGLCAGLVCAAQISFVFWTAYVVSETVFLLLLALCADRVLLLSRSAHPGRDALVAGGLALLSIGTRPTGAVFVAVVLLVLVLIARGSRQSFLYLLGGFSLPFVLVLGLGVAAAAAVGTSFPRASGLLVADRVRSSVELGLLWTETGRATSGVDVDVYPPPIIQMLPADQRDEFLRLGTLAFAAAHPEFVLQQDARKLRMFWTPVLPEYSVRHAIAETLYFAPFYFLATLGFFTARRATVLTALTALSVLAFTLLSVITFVDYDQRYRLPVELMLVPMAGIGLAWVMQRARIRGAKRQPRLETSRAQPVQP